MRKAFVVLNPAAGHSEPDTLRSMIDRVARQSGWQCHLHEMEKNEPLDRVLAAARAEGYELFVAAGGDGTVSAVAAGLVGSGLPLGIVPVGTGNVLARQLNIPLKEEAALRLIFQEHDLKQIDGLWSGDHVFLLNLSAGPIASIMRDITAQEKQRLGFVAYVYQGLKKLFGEGRHRFTITVDGQEYQFCASEAMVLNSPAVGSPKLNLGPNVAMDDGRAEVYLLRSRTVFDYAQVVWNAAIRRKRRARAFRRFVATDSVTIQVDPSMPVQGDGEYIGRTPVQVEVLAGAAMIAVPARNGQA